MKHKTIAVIIPCYNEAVSIGKVVTDFKTALPQADIYVYDNNSTDGTDAAARDAGAIVRYERNQGKGNVMRAAFRDIDADCYLMVDGDDTYPAESAQELCRFVLDEGADMAIGDRLSSTYFAENKRPFHNWGNVLVRRLVNTIFHGKVTDIMTGYRALSYGFVKTFPLLSRGFEIETEMTLHALDKNLNIRAISVSYRDRAQDSESKLSTFSDGTKVLMKIFNLFRTYKPLAFFSMWAGAFILTATGLFIPILIEYLNTHLVPRFPTLFVCGFLALAAILSLVCGFILDTVANKSKQTFEVQLTFAHMLRRIGNDKH